MKDETRAPHDELQSRYFDERASIFVQPIPEAIQERTRTIVRSAKLDPDSIVLDVGTGSGVLIRHFMEEKVGQRNIVGCDLSTEMIKNARSLYPEVYYFHGDILDFPVHERPPDFPAHITQFDRVFFNACFGNIFDQKQAVRHCTELLNQNGQIAISHPLGAKFVEQLHKSEPEIVPHLLPPIELLRSWCSELNLRLCHFDDREGFYLAIMSIE